MLINYWYPLYSMYLFTTYDNLLLDLLCIVHMLMHFVPIEG